MGKSLEEIIHKIKQTNEVFQIALKETIQDSSSLNGKN